MAECDWAILCDYAFLDVNRKTCMIGTFDKVFASNVPTVLNRSALAIKFLGQPTESVNFRMEIVRPTGGLLGTLAGTVQLAETGTAEMQLNIAGLSLPDYGVYAFKIYEGDSLLKVISFMVEKPPQPQMQARP
jgi:hypothetical protein